jgi:integrase
MGIKRLDNGVFRVRARLRISGRIVQTQKTITGTREQAKIEVERMKAEIRGASGRSLTIKNKTFADLITFYIERHDIGKSKPLFDRLHADLGAVKIEELTDRFDCFLQILKRSMAKRTGNPISSGTMNRYLAWGKAICNFAVLHGLIKENPLRRFQRLKESPRDRILTTDEQGRLLTALKCFSPHLLPAVSFALQIPCRTNEIVNMKREHLNLFKNTITLPGALTKNGEPCTKMIPPGMLEYFRQLPKETDFLFYRRDTTGRYHGLGDFKKSWHHALDKAGIKDFVFHSLRHCAVTSLRNAGTPDQAIHMLAGWKHGDHMMRTYYGFREEKIFNLVRFPAQCANSCENISLKMG